MSRISFGIDKKIEDFGFSRPNRASGISIDTNAAAFLTAAGITDPTISSAIDKLVVDLKAANIWTKMKAIYPMVGGTASTHKWNLKDPRDLDNAYRILWIGGVSHSATGILGNGVNGCGNTKFIPSTSGLSINSFAFGLYSRTNNTVNGFDMGATPISDRSEIDLFLVGQTYLSNNGAFHNISPSRTDGFFVNSRTSSSNFKFFRNGTLLSTVSSNSTNLTSVEMQLLHTGGGATSYSNREQCFAFLSDGLSDAEVLNLNNIVNLFQSSLSRQV